MEQMGSAMIAVIGCGVWGRNHVRELREMGVLRAVHDSNPNACEGIVPLQDIWNNPAIHGVVIATPPTTHAEMAVNALGYGKHVLVEKPMAVHRYDASLMKEAAANYNRILMAGHLMRYHPGFMRLHDIVHSGEIGAIEYVYTNRLQPGRIRTEENSLWSLAPHDVSMVVALCGMPESVSCTGSPLRGEQADITMAKMQLSPGVRGHIFISWLHPLKKRLVYVIGSEGSAAFYEHEAGWGVSLNGEEILSGGSANPLRSELQHFIQCIETGASPITDGLEGANVVRVLGACQLSMECEGERVDV